MLKKIEELKDQRKKRRRLLTIKTDQESKSAFRPRSRAMSTLPDAPSDALPAALPAAPPVAGSANVSSSSPVERNDLRKYVK